jgi:hypothetical protein
MGLWDQYGDHPTPRRRIDLICGFGYLATSALGYLSAALSNGDGLVWRLVSASLFLGLAIYYLATYFKPR